MKLLQSGRLPSDRIANVVELVCQRGNAADLAYIYRQCLAADGFSGDVRLHALQHLADAARSRKVRPDADLSTLADLLTPSTPDSSTSPATADDPQTRLVAVRLAGLWKVDRAAAPLKQIALDDQSSSELREAAIGSLVEIGGPSALATVETLASAEQPQHIRFLAVAALTSLDLDRAALLAPGVLADSPADSDPAPMMSAFLGTKGGPEKLAAALDGRELPVDAAKLALRYMYSVGRSDPVLSNALSTAAGIGAEMKPLTKPELDALAAEVLEKGDAARGEAIFRRADLSCFKCHSLSKAGGVVGPDLSALGGSSPVDYVLRSILFPNESIKEQYKTIVVVTVDGKVYTGIPVDRNDDRLLLKLADGQQKVIPADDIDDEGEGQSLMPNGLTRFLTHAELLDLSRFISELGKPGPYAIRTRPTMQRWRVLKQVPDDLAALVPDNVNLRLKVLDAPPERWLPAYARVGGQLPLAEATAVAESTVVYVYGDVDVTAAGPVGLRLGSSDGVTLWIGDQPQDLKTEITADLPAGPHKIVLRIDTAARNSDTIALELFRVPASPTEFNVVDGP